MQPNQLQQQQQQILYQQQIHYQQQQLLHNQNASNQSQIANPYTSNLPQYQQNFSHPQTPALPQSKPHPVAPIPQLRQVKVQQRKDQTGQVPVVKQSSQEKLKMIDLRLTQNITEQDRIKLTAVRAAVVVKMQEDGITMPVKATVAPVPSGRVTIQPTANKTGVPTPGLSQVIDLTGDKPDARSTSTLATQSVTPRQAFKPTPTPMQIPQKPQTQPVSIQQPAPDDPLIPANSIQSLLTHLSPTSLLEQDVQLLMQDQLATFVDSAILSSLRLARHRLSTQSAPSPAVVVSNIQQGQTKGQPAQTNGQKTSSNLAVRDVRLAVDLAHGISLAGYGESEPLNLQVRRPGRMYKINQLAVENAKIDKKRKR